MQKYPSIGAFYQCHKRPKAFLATLKSFRRYYPHSSLYIVSDNGYDYSHAAQKFNFKFVLAERKVGNGAQNVFDSKDNVLMWLNRLYNAALNHVTEDYLIILEDDVYVKSQVTRLDHDLNGVNHQEKIGVSITDYLKKRNVTIPAGTRNYFYGGCGGSIIRREFIVNKFVPGDLSRIIDELSQYTLIEGGRVNRFSSDYWLTLLILYYGGSIGQYKGYCEKWYKSFWVRNKILKNIEVLHQDKSLYVCDITPEERLQLFGKEVVNLS